MEGSDYPYDDEFAVVSSNESAAASPIFEGMNVCRVAALSTLLQGEKELLAGIGDPLVELGIPDALAVGERTWADGDPLEPFVGLSDLQAGGDESGGDRVERWVMINETLAPQAGVAFLVAVLGSPLERESTAAAAALSRQVERIDPRRISRSRRWRGSWDWWYDVLGPEWASEWWPSPWAVQQGYLGIDSDIEESGLLAWEPERWLSLYRRATTLLGDLYGDVALISLLAHWRLSRALRSPDAITRSLAQSAFWSPTEQEPTTPSEPPAAPPRSANDAGTSTMIHGTWAWPGRWWEPGGDFHTFILSRYRKNLYVDGAFFNWSGRLSRRHRRRAAERFAKWALAEHRPGLETVFAHSYGGDVAAQAMTDHHTPVNELVLLSAPVTKHIEAAVLAGARVVDIRLYFDPVLALACRGQRIQSASEALTEVVLERWRLDHGASHREPVWGAEKVAERGAI